MEVVSAPVVEESMDENRTQYAAVALEDDVDMVPEQPVPPLLILH